MVERVSMAEAKAHLSELVAAVAHGRTRIVLERRGRALAALVSLEELAQLEDKVAQGPAPRGALGLIGAWDDATDEEIDALIEDIYAQRERDLPRPVELPE
jgi:prevent-host-death family protein